VKCADHIMKRMCLETVSSMLREFAGIL
jgi:hypothetical protein